MTGNLRIRFPRLAAALAVGAVGLFALGGCKSKDGGNGKSRVDPLMAGPGKMIPPQNVPVPDRGGIGKNGKASDPLLGAPAGRSGGVGYSDDPERWKGPFIPGAGSVPAALAGKSNDDDALKIESAGNAVPLQPNGGVVPASATDGAVDKLYSELEAFGVKREDRTLTREDGKYAFRASVPISGSGAKRQYSGEAANATDAVKQVLDQVIADRK